MPAVIADADLSHARAKRRVRRQLFQRKDFRALAVQEKQVEPVNPEMREQARKRLPFHGEFRGELQPLLRMSRERARVLLVLELVVLSVLLEVVVDSVLVVVVDDVVVDDVVELVDVVEVLVVPVSAKAPKSPAWLTLAHTMRLAVSIP